MPDLTNPEPRAPRLDDFGIWRALWLCIAFDALLALLIWGVWACAH